MADKNKDPLKDLEEQLNKVDLKASSFYEKTSAASAAMLRGQSEDIKKLKKAWAELDDQQKKANKDLLAQIQTLETHYKNQLQVTGRIKQEIVSISDEYIRFLRTTAAQYNLAQEVAKTYKLVARDIGLGGQGAIEMTKSFKEALPNLLQMGVSAENAGRIYTEMADASGRITPMSPLDAERIGGIATAIGMMPDQTTRMAESFRLMGVESKSMEDLVFTTYKQAQKMGLNASKVIKVLGDNMKSMQSYSFAGGVKGMTEMAKQAVKMRIDVSDVLAMADKFYQPEAAIEAAANLQMLGGDIAEAFGDPFETMYLARNKPEELAKKLGDMTENMMTFNDETGQYEFPAEVRMQLKSAGEQLGINTEKMVEMARQTSKIKDIKMKFSSVGDMETKENLASLAQWSETKQEFVIKHDGDELGLDQIGDGLGDEILQANQSDEENIKDIAINTQVMSDKLTSLQKSMEARASLTTNIYEITSGQIEKTMIGPLKKGMDTALDGFVSTVGKNMGKIVEEAGLADSMKGEMDALDNFGKALKENGVDSLKSFGEATAEFIDKLGGLPDSNVTKKKVEKKTEKIEDMVSLPGGDRFFSGSKGSVKVDDNDIVVAGTSLLGNDYPK